MRSFIALLIAFLLGGINQYLSDLQAGLVSLSAPFASFSSPLDWVSP
ncbi:MAG: hypothetical protein ACI9JM_002588 [Halioglobus sp.]|jgi:hypothetical protein